MKNMKTKLMTGLVAVFGVTSILMSSLAFPVSVFASESDLEQRLEALEKAGISRSSLSPEQIEVLNKMDEKEEEYAKYGDTAPLEPDKADKTRAAYGNWSWRDGVICVTEEGSNLLVVNSWHAAIVAPQKIEVVAEAEGIGKTVRLRKGMWTSNKYKIWQVGVKSTSVQQDLKVGEWAGKQVGKPYNLNFWNIKQKDSFYCSQLVWAAYYYTAGVDLDKTDNNIGSAWAVHPGEFVDNTLTAITYRNR